VRYREGLLKLFRENFRLKKSERVLVFVLLDAGGADPGDLEQFGGRPRFSGSDIEQRLVAQDPEDRHLLSPGLLESPLAQRLEKRRWLRGSFRIRGLLSLPRCAGFPRSSSSPHFSTD